MKRRLSFFYLLAIAAFSLNASAQLPAYVPASGLLAYYPFNGNGNDVSGNWVHGAVLGPTFTNDRFGNPNAAVNFTGTAERILTNKINRTVTNDLSYSVWVNPSTSTSIPTQGTGAGLPSTQSYTCVIAPVNGWNWATSGHVAAGLNVATNGVYVTEHGNGITNVALAWAGTLTGWHHIAIVYTSRHPKLYIDGSFVQNGDTSHHVVHPSMGCDSFRSTTSTYPYLSAGFGHGLYPIIVPSYNFTGQIDDIAIYGRSLTPCEVVALYDTITTTIPTISGTPAMCAGTNSTFTTSITGGLWGSSNTSVATVGSSSGIVSAVGSGTATISYSVSGGCTAFFTVSVNILPPITGTTGICLGGTPSSLSNALSGGTWSSSNTSIATVGSSTGIVTGAATGTATITYAVTSTCLATVTVTVITTAPAITGTLSMCSGLTSVLSNPISGGVWSSSNTTIATIGSSSGIVTGVAPGFDTISYTIGGSCAATAVVTVSSAPGAITGTMWVCAGSTVTLSNSLGGGTWSSGNTAIATIGSSSGVVTGVAAGFVIISYTGLGCGVAAMLTVNTMPGIITGASAVCVDATTSLMNPVSGGVWSSSNVSVATVSTTGVVLGVSPGVSTISYTMGTVCTTIKPVTVNGNPAPIAGAMILCTGATTVLTDAVTGGSWSSSDVSMATVGPGTGLVTGLSAGTVQISYSMPTGCFVIAVVTLNQSPSPVTGTAQVCIGSTTTLSNVYGGGIWSSGSPIVATVGSGSGIATGVSAGTAIITYTLPAGCFVTRTVTVDPLPAMITGTFGICLGTTPTLSDATGGGLWSSGNPAVAVIGTTSGLVTGIAAGIAIITYTLPTGCYVTATATVHPLPLPIVGVLGACVGSTSTLYPTPGGGSWSSSLPAIATADPVSGIVTGVAAGTTTITYALPSGCVTTASFTVDPVPAPITGLFSLCTGSSVSLSNTTIGGNWSSSDFSIAFIDITTGVVTGLSIGSATITYRLPSSGCYSTAGVTVNTVPAAITGTGNVCVGATANLYNSISGGTWTSGNPSIATIHPSTGVYTGVSAGTANMSYSTGAGCTVVFPVTIYPSPSPITGTLNVCVAATTALSNASIGGTWSASGGATISGGGLVSGTVAGTAIISYTLPTGCRVTTIVTVNPLPTAITGTLQVCPATTSALSGSPGSGTWLSSNTAVATIGSGTGLASGVATGTSVIRYTLPTGCSITGTLTVNPLPSAITGASSVCVGASAGLIAAPGGGTWSTSNANLTIGTVSGVVTGVNAGTSVVTYTLPTGCYVTKTMTINSSPGTIAGALQVCAGGSISLSIGVGGGFWSSGITGIAIIGSSTGVVTGVVAGISGITYSVGTGCMATAMVTVNALPAAFTVTGGGSYCAGDAGVHIGLSGSATGVSYQLYLGPGAAGPPLAGTGAPLDFGLLTATGIYTIVATSAQGCTSTMTGSVAIAINPLPGPIGGPSAVCVGGASALSAGAGSGVWSSGATGVATIGSTSGLVTGVTTGTATITYTLPTTCAATKTITVSSTPTAIIGPSTVCEGASAALAVTPAGGVWSSLTATIAVGSLSGIVTGVTAGPAAVTYSLGTGCTVTKTMTVLVSPAAIGGSSQLCVAGSTSLTMTTGGGVWTSAGTGVATVSGTGVVSGVSAGTAVISYTAGGCSSTKTVTVNAVPSAITGTGSVCMGATSAGLSVTPGGGTWSTTATTLTIGSTDGVVTGVSAGTGVVTYSLGTGTTACTVTRTITVNAAPLISGASGVCVGSTSAWSVGAVSGVWSSGGTGIATVSSAGLVTGVSAGTAAITFAPVTGCVAIRTITVNTTPGAITGTAQVCVGGASALSVSSGSGGVWTSGSTVVATIGSLSGVVNGVVAGVATITYSLGTGCTVTKVVTVNPLPAAITGGAMVCIGSITVLSSPTAGGAWSSGTTGIATVNTLGVVSGVAIGTATISYTLTTGCAATKIVTVNSLPGSITGAGHVCDGASTTLSSTGGGVWSSSNPSIASIGSGTGVVTGVYAGTATITYSVGAGCEVMRTMTVHPLPGGITGTSNICIGGTTALTTASSGGVWSSGTSGIATVGGSSGIVTGVSGGSATISYTVITTGCASTYSITVITVPALTGLTDLCAWGDTVTVYNSNPAGTYSSSLVTVLNLGGGAGKVTAFAPGTGYITYTLAGVGCARTTAVTVNTLPGLIAGTTNLCAGSASTLSNSVGGGVWSAGSTTVATIGSSSGLLTGMGAGSTNIRYTIPNGCKVDTMVYVSVFPVAGTIAGAGAICVGSSASLTVTGSGGVWTSGAVGVATIDAATAIVTGVSAGTAAISYAVTNVCGTATATSTMTINPIPDAGVITGTDSLCVGSLTMLTNIVTGGVWSSVNGNAVVSATGLVTGVASGMDTVIYTVTSAEGCVGSAVYPVKVKPWGLCGALTSPRPSPQERVTVWPNPARDELHVENAMGCDVRIYNMLGQPFGRLTMTSDKEVLNIERLTPGVYVIEVVGDFGKESRRLVVGR